MTKFVFFIFRVNLFAVSQSYSLQIEFLVYIRSLCGFPLCSAILVLMDSNSFFNASSCHFN